MRSVSRIAAAGLGLAAMLQLGAAQAQEAPTAGPPPADQPLLKSVPPPRFTLDGSAGVLGYLGGTAAVGPVWNGRVTVFFGERFGVEGNYTGSVNSRSDGAGTLVYTALDADLRVNVLRADQAPVQPYFAGGVGFATWGGPGGTSALTVPLAFGVERMLTRNLKFGGRFQLRPAFFDDLSIGTETNHPGGDTWSLIANLGGAF